MTPKLIQHLEALRSELTKLPPTGGTGFEGLLATVLTKISGSPFRLSKGGGPQGGYDGKTDWNAISFEAKLYTRKIDRESLITKVADLGRNLKDPDPVWILGATVPISSTDRDDLHADAEAHGISAIFLDWSATTLPELAVLLAGAPNETAEFLAAQLPNRSSLNGVADDLAEISQHEDFSARLERIRKDLSRRTANTTVVGRANGRWLYDAFSNRKLALSRLGQACSPAASDNFQVLPRAGLRGLLKAELLRPPSDDIILLAGNEGCGKSWLFAATWLELPEPPLTLFLSAEDAPSAWADSHAEEFLIGKLIHQTGEYQESPERWRRRLRSWAQSGPGATPRLLVVLDGLNQRPNFAWGRILTGLAGTVARLGGRLVATTRTAFHEQHLAQLPVPTSLVIVPEWTPAERDQILLRANLIPGTMSSKVAESLLNPRLLGVALQILRPSALTSLADLSTSHLLFEYIRTSKLDGYAPNAKDFARELSQHAKKVLERIKEAVPDDVYVFDLGSLDDVAEGRFFRSLPGEPDKYQLREEGRTLALGIALSDHIRGALRNGRDPVEAIRITLEPISALDDAAEVTLAALVAMALQDDADAIKVLIALVVGFAGMQNPPRESLSTLCIAAQQKPAGFLQALDVLCAQKDQAPNHEWICEAAQDAAHRATNWEPFDVAIRRWLMTYTLSEDMWVEALTIDNPHGEKAKSLREERRSQLQSRLASLSARERDILTRSNCVNHDPEPLTNFALKLLGGKALASYASEMVCRAFADSLNSSFHSTPFEHFQSLLRYNVQDWALTREALLLAVHPLRQQAVTSTGRWALLTILRATGAPSDADEGQVLEVELTRDRTKLSSRRRVEAYCATDPCDPCAKRPDNLDETEKKWDSLDPSNLRSAQFATHDDHFYDDAKCAVTRFSLDHSLAKHQAFISSLASRQVLPYRQAIFELLHHSALLSTDQAVQLVRSNTPTYIASVASSLPEKDRRVLHQYILYTAFPHLTAPQQVEALLLCQEGDNYLRDLLRCAKSLTAEEFDHIELTSRNKDTHQRQYTLLSILHSTQTPITDTGRALLMQGLKSAEKRQRYLALSAIRRAGDKTLLEAAIKRPSFPMDDQGDLEAWHRSAVLLMAATQRLIPTHEALDRITPVFYGRAAAFLDGIEVECLATRIDAAISSMLRLEPMKQPAAIDIVADVQNPTALESPLFGATERQDTNDIQANLRALAADHEEYSRRQERNREEFQRVRDHLSKGRAELVLEHVDASALAKLIRARPDLGEKWHGQFMRTHDARIPFIRNLALTLANAIAIDQPAMADRLIRKMRASKSLVEYAFGAANIGLDEALVWQGPNTAEFNLLRNERLDGAATDHALASEVMAALSAGQEEFLSAYVRSRLAREEPSRKGRALMVAGFSDQSEFNDQVLNLFPSDRSMLGMAQSAARYAYERNTWSRFWFREMCVTPDPTRYWQCAILLSKIVDRRIWIWAGQIEPVEAPFSNFWPLTVRSVSRRCDRWKSKREKTLLGGSVPDPAFLSGQYFSTG
jgi:hypothetical protein